VPVWFQTNGHRLLPGPPSRALPLLQSLTRSPLIHPSPFRLRVNQRIQPRSTFTLPSERIARSTWSSTKQVTPFFPKTLNLPSERVQPPTSPQSRHGTMKQSTLARNKPRSVKTPHSSTWLLPTAVRLCASHRSPDSPVKVPPRTCTACTSQTPDSTWNTAFSSTTRRTTVPPTRCIQAHSKARPPVRYGLEMS